MSSFMETLSLEAEDSLVETYLLLGLNGTGKQNTGKPVVLSYLSLLLERCVKKNERLVESASSTQVKDIIITVFHGSSAPSLSIGQYIDRIYKYSCCSPACFIVAHIYIERYIQRTNVILTSLNVHRLLITSLLVAAKFVDDAFFNNAYYARVGGVSTSEMNKLEMKFLFSLDFKLHVSVDTFGKYCLLLLLEKEGEGNEIHQIERSIQACGIKETNCWPSKKDESTFYYYNC